MSDIRVNYDGDTYWLQCFTNAPNAEKGDIICQVDAGDSWGILAENVAEHQARHGCAPAKVVVGMTTPETQGQAADEVLAAIDRFEADVPLTPPRELDLRIARLRDEVIDALRGLRAAPVGTAWRLLDETRAKLAAVAELTAHMHTEADRIAPFDSSHAKALHEYASRIRQALGPDAVREALEG